MNILNNTRPEWLILIEQEEAKNNTAFEKWINGDTFKGLTREAKSDLMSYCAGLHIEIADLKSDIRRPGKTI